MYGKINSNVFIGFAICLPHQKSIVKLCLQRILKINIMKTNFITTALVLVSGFFAHSQVMGNEESAKKEKGNANYYNNYQNNQHATVNVMNSSQEFMTLTIKGIYNEKATSYVATFSIMQVGTTVEEVTGLLDEKVLNIKTGVAKLNKNIDLVVDMISFVPTYEYEVTKKTFNKKTYNEKPSGFELKKNLMIQYKNASDLDDIISICAKQEVFDLAKVDYVTTNLDSIKTKLQDRVLLEYQNKLKFYGVIKNIDLFKKEKTINEGFNIIYPVENYKKYTAFSQAQLPYSVNGVVNQITKNQTQFYDAMLPKSHSFVMNPDITEPAIQVLYEMTIVIDLREKIIEKPIVQETVPVVPVEKKIIYIVTANGEVKQLDI
jgi:hypothetical protein